jgi:pimeloyl-ACP methyl ester carboxylesterase
MTIQTWQQALPHGITLSCRASGERGRPVLLFLHGFPEAAFIWDELLEHFAQPDNGGYRCVAPNLRGYEASSQPAEVAAYRPKHLVQDLVALAQSEGAPLACLIAHDWGGAVAWNFANQFPQLTNKLGDHQFAASGHLPARLADQRSAAPGQCVHELPDPSRTRSSCCARTATAACSGSSRTRARPRGSRTRSRRSTGPCGTAASRAA